MGDFGKLLTGIGTLLVGIAALIAAFKQSERDKLEPTLSPGKG